MLLGWAGAATDSAHNLRRNGEVVVAEALARVAQAKVEARAAVVAKVTVEARVIARAEEKAVVMLRALACP